MALRIGFLTERMVLGFGVDLVVDQSATHLSRSGYDVVVYTTRTSDAYDEVPYTIVDLSKEVSGEKDIFSLPFMQDSIRYLSREKIDVWILHTPPFYYWCSHLRPPVIIVEHGTPPGYFFPKSVGKRLDAYTKERFQKIYTSMRTGDGLVAISNYIKSEFPPSLQDRVNVIYNGTDHYPRASMEAAEAFRRELGIRPEETMILWVGRIQFNNDPQPYKGLREFVELSSILLKQRPDIRIVAVGKGEPEDRVKLETTGIIPVLNLDREKMPSAFASADIFINTSKWEGFNLPLTEAQFQGTPVVAYRVCSHPEVVSDGYSGILVDNRDEFLTAVMNLVDDPDYRKKLATGARKHSSRFTWVNNAKEMITMLEACYKQAEKNDFSEAPAQIRKNFLYYKTVARDIVRREGWGVLFRELKGWIRRRISKK